MDTQGFKKLFAFFMMLFMIVGGAKAEEVTFDLAQSYTLTQGRVTLGGGTFSVGYYSFSDTNGLLSPLTVSTTSGEITKIVLTFTEDKVDRIGGTPTASTGTYTYDAASISGTWIGSAQSVKINFTNKARITKAVVTTSETTKGNLAAGDLTFNTTDVLYEDQNHTNRDAVNSSTFKFDTTKGYLRVKVNLEGTNTFQSLGVDADHLSQYFSVSSSASDVLDVSGINMYKAANSPTNRIYIEGIKVLKPGKATLKLTFNGSDTYNAANDAAIQEFTILGTYPLSMTTPSTTDVPLKTRIILTAGDKKTIAGSSYTGELKSSDGTDTHSVNLVVASNRLIFTPSADFQLKANKQYTLTIPADIKSNDGTANTFSPTSFTFTTMMPSGSAPSVTSTSPVANSTIDASEVEEGKIVITFSDNIKLASGWELFMHPVNGSEAIRYDASIPAVKWSVSDNTLTLKYSGEDLHYNLYYDVTVPAYSIMGTGGSQMNSDYVFVFKAPRKPGVVDTRENISTKYTKNQLYTWDFTKMSQPTIDAILLDANQGSNGAHFWQPINKNENSTYTDADKTVYGFSNYYKNTTSGHPFIQSDETKSDATQVVNEMRGLWFTMTKATVNNRFVLVNKDEVKSGNIPTTGWALKIKGNTHYLTIPDMPVGKLYIRAGVSEALNINSPNAEFSDGYANETDKTIGMSKPGTRVYVVDIKEAGDLSLIVSGVSLYQMAYTPVTKKFNQFGMTTDCNDYDVRYDLDKVLAGNDVTAHDIAGDYKSDATVVTTSPYTGNVVKAGEGSILIGPMEAIDMPLFAADVNTTGNAISGNLLHGTLESTPLATAKTTVPNSEVFLLTNIWGRYDDNGHLISEKNTESALNFYRWKSGNMAANKAYLSLPNPANGAKSLGFVFLNLFTEDATVTNIHTIDEKIAVGNTDDAYYTLSGIRVEKPTERGIYIHNGKKLIIR